VRIEHAQTTTAGIVSFGDTFLFEHDIWMATNGDAASNCLAAVRLSDGFIRQIASTVPVTLAPGRFVTDYPIFKETTT